MIIRKKLIDKKKFEWCPRRINDIAVYPNIAFDSINQIDDPIIKQLIYSINRKLNVLSKNKTIVKKFINNNTIETLKTIDNYLNTATDFVKIIIYNYDINIHIEVLKHFFVIDCIHNENNKNIIINLNNSIKLENKISFGFINFNHYNNNNRFLLDYALKSLEKYNNINNFNFIIINDNLYKENDYILEKDNFISYDINNFNKIKFNPTMNNIDLSHSSKIDILFNLCKTKYLFLCDCDILFKKNIDEYIELLKKYDIVGEMGYDKIYPFFLGLNLETLHKNNFTVSDFGKLLYDNSFITNNKLKEKIQQFKFKNISLDDIIWHYGGVSSKTRLDENADYNLYVGQNKYIKDDIKRLTIDEFIKLM